MNMPKVLVAFASSLGLSLCAALSSTVVFDNYNLLASYRSDGLYNLAGLGTWNGQPVSDVNRPSDYERELAATVSLFAQPSQPNVMFVQVGDVIATHFGFAFGSAFVNITQTGVRLTLPVTTGGSLGLPGMSLDFANPGETLVFAPPNGSASALTTTPGYGLAQVGANQFLIQTLSGADYGFINGGWSVNGTASRIEGGGVFQITFASGIDLFNSVNFNAATVESQYGAGNQYILASLVPEPSSGMLLCTMGSGLALSSLRRRKNCNGGATTL